MARHGVTQFLELFNDVGRVFFDLESDLLIVVNEHGEIFDCNPATERELNRAKAEMLSVPFMRFFYDGELLDFVQEFYKPRGRCFRMLRRESGEIQVRLIAFRSYRDYGYIVLRRVA